VKARIEKTTLGDVIEYIEEIYSCNDHFLVIKLDIDKIKLLKLKVDVCMLRMFESSRLLFFPCN